MNEKAIEDDFISHLEWLARIELDKTEKERLRKELIQLMNYIDHVLKIDTTGFEPLIYPKPSMELREDVPRMNDDHSVHLIGALLENGYVKGPRVIKK